VTDPDANTLSDFEGEVPRDFAFFRWFRLAGTAERDRLTGREKPARQDFVNDSDYPRV
jgi:hypothetical protein